MYFEAFIGSSDSTPRFHMRKKMSSKNGSSTRRTIIFGAAGLPALGALALSTPAAAAGTTPQSAVKYQMHPNGPNQCSKCNYFIPGANPKAPAHCKVVAGNIIPNGWCQLFAAKH
jgi:hypothetical protein